MSSTKTPTSSMSVAELLVKRVWYRSLARIRRIHSVGTSPETSRLRPPSATWFPQEIVQMVIAHLIYDTRSLLACSLTCYSWYIAAVPHLHHALIIPTCSWSADRKFLWPKSLPHMHKLGLLPLVKTLQVHEGWAIYGCGFSPKLFNRRILRQFSALTNIQELGINRLNIPKFMPKLQRYFGHFLPTVRSLALRRPKGSRRQIIFFIGLFQHLEDLRLRESRLDSWDSEPMDDLTLLPPFTPPLRGRLVMTYFRREGFLEDMIDLFGGIRFRYMDLFDVAGTRLLLNACANTLETLRWYPLDPCAADGVDLSQNKSLREFEVVATSTFGEVPDFLASALSTVTSPAFSEVIVFYRDCDFRGVESTWPEHTYPFRWVSETEIKAAPEWWYHNQFEAFRKMQKVRDFQLVLCADVWERVGEDVVRALKLAISAEKAKGEFDGPFSEPVLIYNPRRSRTAYAENFAPGYPTPWVPL